MVSKQRSWGGVGIAILVWGGLFALGPVLQAEEGKSTAQASSAASNQVEVASFAQVQDWVAKQRGKVVIVDYWSSWCVPCLKELPELVHLQQEISKNPALAGKVVFATVDVDFAGTAGEKPEDHRETVVGILQKNKVVARNFISSDPDTVVFDKLRVASVPTLHVFDKNGKLQQKFDNESETFGKDGFSILKHVRPLVLELVK